MAAINPLIDEKELKHDLLKRKPEGMFVVYDEMMDDLIIKLVRPETFTSLYHLNDEIALIVDPITLLDCKPSISNILTKPAKWLKMAE
jgi:hypothetical protein